MIWSIFQWRSLKTRVTLFTLAVFLIGIWSLQFYANRMLREDMQRQLGEQQFSTVSILAAQVNQDLDDRLRALELTAGEIAPTLIGNTAGVQALLEDRPLFQRLFNGGAYVTGLDGVVMATFPVSTKRIGVNFMNDENSGYLVEALKGNPAISRPFFGRLLKAPLFVLAVPIRDTQDKVIGALSGVIDLGKPNFLDKFTAAKYGNTGGHILVAPQFRLIVTATDKRRIMESLPAPGVIPMMDRFIQGYEGSAVYVNPLGVEQLASAKNVPLSGWQVGIVLPTEEAFSPIRDMQRRMLLMTTVLTVLASGLIWWSASWMLRRQLAPMITATKELDTLSGTNRPLQPLPVTSQDEIGELIGGFNRLLETLGRREIALRMSEERHRTILHTAIDGFWLVDMQGRLLEVNEAYCRMSGYSAQELLSMRILDVEAVESAADTAARIQKIMAQGEDRFESRHRRKDGSEFDVEVSVQHQPDEGGHFVVFLHDVTERKQAEEALHESEKRQSAVFHASPIAISVTTMSDGRYVDINEAALRLYGRRRDEMMGRTVAETGIYADLTRRADLVTQLAEKGQVDGFEFDFRNGSGDLGKLELTGRVIQLRGEPCLVAMMLEVTERKRAAARLAEQLDELRRWQQATLGREGRVAAVKREVNALLAERGQQPRYPSAVDDGPEK